MKVHFVDGTYELAIQPDFDAALVPISIMLMSRGRFGDSHHNLDIGPSARSRWIPEIEALQWIHLSRNYEVMVTVPENTKLRPYRPSISQVCSRGEEGREEVI